MPNKTRIIAGRYELLKEIGRGGMSKVYLAMDQGLNKSWAVKQISKKGVLKGREVKNSLLAEAKMMKDLDHPALPRIVDIIEEKDYYYIVMDYVEGENLKTIIDNTGPQSQEQVLSWAMELAAVLQYLHSQDPPIIYRDMKPANTILQPNGTIKLIDFGIARTYKIKQSKDTMPLGTPGYAAPEQFDRGDGQQGQTDARTDIYNLGVTMYELLTCKLPSAAPYHLVPLRKLRPEISVGVEKIVSKCTHPDPNERFQTAEELMIALLNYHKYDGEYIESQKRKLLKAIIPFIAGLVLLFSGTALSIVNSIMVSNNYDTLLMETGNHETRIANLEKAITLKPEETESYDLLIKEHAKDGLTEQESEKALRACNTGLSSLKKGSEEYLDINYMLGENYLVYYTGKTDDSLRNKIITAAPFFDAVINNGTEEYKNYKMAKSYSMLADFYEEYVLGSNTTFVIDADQKDYEELFKEFDSMLSLLSVSDRNNQIKTVTCNIMLSIIDSERNNMSKSLSKNKMVTMVDSIRDTAAGIETSNVVLQEQKKEIIALCGDIKEKIDETYEKNKRK